MVARVVATVLAVPYVLVFGSSAAAKVLTVGALILLPVVMLIVTHRAETARVARLHLWYGLAAEVIAVAGMPRAFPMIVLLAGSTITAGVFGSRGQSGILIGTIGAALIAAIGRGHGVDNWLMLSFALIFVAPVAHSTRKVMDAISGHENKALNAITASSQSIVWEAELATGAVTTVAGAVEHLTGLSPKVWADLEHDAIVHPDDAEGFRDFSTLRPDNTETTPRSIVWEGRIKGRTGGWLYVREWMQLESGEDGLDVVRGSTIDINEIVAANKIAERRANYDELTGLPNRARMFDLAKEAMATGVGVALLHANIDGFTEVNKTLGHEVGDDYLVTIGQRLSAMCDKDSMTIGRIGGDEFAVLIAGFGEQSAKRLAQEISDSCGKAVALSGISLTLGAAVGIAVTEPGDTDHIALFRQADSALHEAKDQHQAWNLAEPADLDAARARLELVSQVEQAIRQSELELFFQPKVRLDNQAVIGFEGLIRWRHPEHDLLFPDQFLDLIELSGQFEAFNRLVIEQGIEFCSQAAALGRPVKVSLNLAGRALQNGAIVELIRQTLKMWDVEAQSLVIEVTEDSIQGDLETVKAAITALSELGCGISIDDFGTGDSSLTRLRELPVTEIKIDRSFVMDLLTDQRGSIIVRSTIDLAQTLGVTCCAEGIEDKETAAQLVAWGCSIGQGWLYAKALPAAQALHYLEAAPVTAESE